MYSTPLLFSKFCLKMKGTLPKLFASGCWRKKEFNGECKEVYKESTKNLLVPSSFEQQSKEKCWLQKQRFTEKKILPPLKIQLK